MAHNYGLVLRSYKKRFDFYRQSSQSLQDIGKVLGLIFLFTASLFFLIHLCGMVVAGLVLVLTLEKVWGFKLDPWNSTF